MKELIEKTFEYANEILKNDTTGHGMDHIKRVYNIGLQILKKSVDVNKEVIILALILHDIDDPKITKDYNGDCTQARSYLKTLTISDDDQTHICNIINNMSYSKNKETKQVLTKEGQIVQDADRIDAIGAMGVARTFQYGGAKGRSMLDTISHFDEKLLLLYDLLNTKEAKEIALERHEFVVNFYNQFHKEYTI